MPAVKLTALVRFLTFSVALVAATAYFPPPDSDGGWREAKTEKAARELAGIDLAKLEPAFTITDRSTQNGGLWWCGAVISRSNVTSARRAATPIPTWPRLGD
jgi:hypothetical protein